METVDCLMPGRGSVQHCCLPAACLCPIIGQVEYEGAGEVDRPPNSHAHHLTGRVQLILRASWLICRDGSKICLGKNVINCRFSRRAKFRVFLTISRKCWKKHFHLNSVNFFFENSGIFNIRHPPKVHYLFVIFVCS